MASSEEKKPRRRTQQTYESEGEESEEYVPPPPRKARALQRQRAGKGGQLPLDSLALDSVRDTAGGLVNSATGVLGDVAGNAVQQQQSGGGGKNDTLKLRLDLNLDIEITLKAKIHGDLELALLLVHFSLPWPVLCFAVWTAIWLFPQDPVAHSKRTAAKITGANCLGTEAYNIRGLFQGEKHSSISSLGDGGSLGGARQRRYGLGLSLQLMFIAGGREYLIDTLMVGCFDVFFFFFSRKLSLIIFTRIRLQFDLHLSMNMLQP
jgi:hypothetical protein